MNCLVKSQLSCHDYSKGIMIHLSSHSLSGNQSAARNGDSNAKRWGESPVMLLDLEQPDDSFSHIEYR